jgi:CP family cyanate transporter-like MFS transporter
MSATLTGLMGTALLGGASIGMIQALMPALIKREYTQTASTVMSLFSTGIMAGAALAAASAEPLFSWLALKPALAMAGVLALLALILWLALVKHHRGQTPVRETVTLSLPYRAMLLFFGVGTGPTRWFGLAATALYSGGMERTQQRLYAGLANINRSCRRVCRLCAD